jgi:hypothetical protein
LVYRLQVKLLSLGILALDPPELGDVPQSSGHLPVCIGVHPAA